MGLMINTVILNLSLDSTCSHPACIQILRTASNGTDRRRQPKAVLKNVHHNHSYPLQPGQMSREEKEAITKREKEEKAIRCRDEKRAKEMKIPFNLDDIIDMPVDQFSEMLSEYKLTESQLQLIRDIRRRGKNKQAAQNCRKRKLDVIQTLEEEVEGLRNERDQLEQKRHQMKRETSQLKEKIQPAAHGDLSVAS